jgi:hypothetical protein
LLSSFDGGSFCTLLVLGPDGACGWSVELEGWFTEGGTLGADVCGPLLGALSAVRLHAATAASATIRTDNVAFLIVSPGCGEVGARRSAGMRPLSS